ncbi:MAG: carboxylating nicotinate-nucleotide diphosphorylase, partial [candidate division Zixibacteria bacterium]|nr:carboxylating nicotinate-nucleotide diphosphorylase [candidate division Zixibacteria bacterium]
MDPHFKTTLELVKAALAEDIGRGDLTSLGCLEPGPVKAQIVAKGAGVLSGTAPAQIVFDIVDSANTLEFAVQDGERFAYGDVIARIDGFNQTVLASERVALNFLGKLSGIATLTRTYADRIPAGCACRILDTRKTTPGWRYLEKQAVVHGGGMNHRFGLYDMALIKDNHIAASGSISEAVAHMREYMTTRDFRLQFDTDAARILIEVEVTSQNQLAEAIAARVDRVLLDNQTIESLASMVKIARQLDPTVQLEASGNVSLETVAAIAATGVDYISVG